MMIVFAIAVLLGLSLWSSAVRTWIYTAALWTQTAFYNLMGHLPGVGTWMADTTVRTARTIRNILLRVWLTFIVVFWVAGYYSGQTKEGLLIGFFAPIYLYLMWRSKTVRWIMLVPVIALFVWHFASFTFGVAFPSWKKEASAWMEAKFESGKIEVHKSIAQSQSHAGSEGWIGFGSELQMLTADSVEILVPGTRVFIVELDKVSASEKGQGLTQVMLRDENGYFRNGKVGLVPSQRIVWKPIVVVVEGGVKQLDY